MDEYGDNLLNGSGTDTDAALENPGYDQSQDPFDAADNGTLTVSPNTSGGTTATTTPPTWLSQITQLAGAAGTSATTLSPLINGQPTGSTPGATKTVTPAKSNNLLILGVVAVVAFVVLAK